MRSAVVGVLVAALAGLTACGGGGGGSSQTPVPNPLPPGSPVVGLDQRPANATCLAPSRSAAGVEIALERVFANVSFASPLAMLQAPGDASRWFVVEKQGRVRVFANQANAVSANDFLAIDVNANSEGGLLGMAFHPQFAANGEVFLSFTEGSPMVSTVARFVSEDGGATLALASRENVIRVSQPFDNHNGGHIAFGPDGYFYIGFGDGGSGGDPQGHAQDTRTLLGNFLRIDVDGAAPYAIPPDNPFAGRPMCTINPNVRADDCPEIYAWGFRNPWRWSFDRATGVLWAGDVGQNAREEVDVVERGGNYGWNCREGASAYSGAPAACGAASEPMIDPVHQYGHTLGNSITGGYVYRGAAVPGLTGTYVFGDFGSRRIWRLAPNGSGGYVAELLLQTNLSIASFAEDLDGELYVVDLGGTLHRIVAAGAASPAPPVATLLSATGCVNPQAPSEPASGLIPYTVAAPFWSDGATKERWLALPNSTAIAVAQDGDFDLPPGSVTMKHFRANGSLIETRLLMRHPDGGWAGYSYEWNAARTDATLVQGGKTVALAGQDQWIFPSEAECLVCHSAAAGFTLGLEAAQLNRDFTYPATGRTANQLRTLDHIVLLTSPFGDPAATLRLPDPFDAAAPLGERARAYLHTNCANCHRSGAAGGSLDLRFTTALSSSGACDAPPQAGDLGIGPGARIVAPGSPDNSVLLARVTRRDASGMPPLASTAVDDAGAALLRDWITSLAGCL